MCTSELFGTDTVTAIDNPKENSKEDNKQNDIYLQEDMRCRLWFGEGIDHKRECKNSNTYYTKYNQYAHVCTEKLPEPFTERRRWITTLVHNGQSVFQTLKDLFSSEKDWTSAIKRNTRSDAPSNIEVDRDRD